MHTTKFQKISLFSNISEQEIPETQVTTVSYPITAITQETVSSTRRKQVVEPHNLTHKKYQNEGRAGRCTNRTTPPEVPPAAQPNNQPFSVEARLSSIEEQLARLGIS